MGVGCFCTEYGPEYPLRVCAGGIPDDRGGDDAGPGGREIYEDAEIYKEILCGRDKEPARGDEDHGAAGCTGEGVK